MGRVEALLVEAVADLVEDAEECVAEVVLVVPRRDPAVARPDPGAKRVGAYVEPPGLKSKPTAAATVSPKIFWRSRG